MVRCLIVDDSPRFLEAARRLLERQGIQVVGVARTGAEAVARAAELRPEVALVDVNLAGESGIRLAGRLRRDGRPGVPQVILISARDGGDLTELIAASPAVGFLAKSALSAGAIHGLLAGVSGRQGT